MSSLTAKTEQSTGGVHCAAVSDVGMRRTNNQDSMALVFAEGKQQWQSHGHLFVVADGMGAHAAGELASKLAADTVSHSYYKRQELSASEAIVEAVRQANGVIHNKGSKSVDFQGMGTTCSCLLVLPQGALAAHVGDSRVYRLRGTCFEQLTFDHSLVWEMAAAGHATEEEVPAFVPKNVITRSLGPHPTVAVDLEGPFRLRSGDRFLLCSDGLTGPLQPELIGAVLGALPIDQAAQTLVDLANLLGGPDNITTVVIEITDAAQLGVEDTVEEVTHRVRWPARGNFIHPFCWLTMLICGAVGGAMVASKHWGGAFLALAAFLIAGIVGWLQRGQQGTPCRSETAVRIGGKAPYRRHDCTPSSFSISTLGDIVRQLEDLEGQSNWKVSWDRIHQDRQVAHEAITQGNYQQAVVAYCSAVRQLMQGLRDAKQLRPSDSAIDLA